jgi:MFS family permease
MSWEQTNVHNKNKIAFSALVFATVVFAINTFNIISIFYLIAAEFKEDVSLLGLISATLVVGIGISQIPGGIMAAKYGPKNTAIIGMLVIMISAVFVGVSTDIYQIAIFRFILGGGLALFFPTTSTISLRAVSCTPSIAFTFSSMSSNSALSFTIISTFKSIVCSPILLPT